jgi:hypothetical protein
MYASEDLTPYEQAVQETEEATGLSKKNDKDSFWEIFWGQKYDPTDIPDGEGRCFVAAKAT